MHFLIKFRAEVTLLVICFPLEYLSMPFTTTAFPSSTAMKAMGPIEKLSKRFVLCYIKKILVTFYTSDSVYFTITLDAVKVRFYC